MNVWDAEAELVHAGFFSSCVSINWNMCSKSYWTKEGHWRQLQFQMKNDRWHRVKRQQISTWIDDIPETNQAGFSQWLLPTMCGVPYLTTYDFPQLVIFSVFRIATVITCRLPFQHSVPRLEKYEWDKLQSMNPQQRSASDRDPSRLPPT